jgi:hypothetical protein
MLSNRLAFSLLGVACVMAAAGGGYLATRQNAVPEPVAASSPATATAASSTATTPADATRSAVAAARPVQETETVATDTRTPAKRPEASVRSSAAQQTKAVNAAVARQKPPSVMPPQSPTPAPPAPEFSAPAPRPEERVAQEPPRAPEPPQTTFEELVVSSDSVIGLQTENRISSETARIEDRVEARVTRDVKVSDRVAIPAGSRVIGAVTVVERGGKFKDAARLCFKFHTLVLADGTRMPTNTEQICRSGEAPGNNSAAKVGGAAIGGAILGAIFGGGKGAAIGAAAGAGGGTAAVANGDRSIVTLPTGSSLTVRVVSPITVTIEQK